MLNKSNETVLKLQHKESLQQEDTLINLINREFFVFGYVMRWQKLDLLITIDKVKHRAPWEMVTCVENEKFIGRETVDGKSEGM